MPRAVSRRRIALFVFRFFTVDAGRCENTILAGGPPTLRPLRHAHRLPQATSSDAYAALGPHTQSLASTALSVKRIPLGMS